MTDAVPLLAAVLTQLGGTPFVVTLVGLAYWVDGAVPWLGERLDRDRLARLLALLVLALAVTTLLKGAFARPRPPGAHLAEAPAVVPVALEGVYHWAATAEGYGFPSGHAVAATVTWGGLAWAVRVGDRRSRAVLASVLVVTVAATRVALGVHVVGDVVAGAAVGVALLAAVILGRITTRHVFAAAVVAAVVAVPLAGPTESALTVVGLTAGGWLGWRLAGAWVSEAGADRRTAELAVALGVAVVAPPLAVAGVGVAQPIMAALLAVVGGAGLMAAPAVGARLSAGP